MFPSCTFALLVDSCIYRLPIGHYPSFSMFHRAKSIRNVVAVCLGLWMPWTATLVGQCFCSGCQDPSSGGISTTATGESLCCTACVSKCCGNECENQSAPRQPCRCACHQAPFTALARSGQASLSLSELVDISIFDCFSQPIMAIETRLGIHASSTCATCRLLLVDACILLCRLLI